MIIQTAAPLTPVAVPARSAPDVAPAVPVDRADLAAPSPCVWPLLREAGVLMPTTANAGPIGAALAPAVAEQLRSTLDRMEAGGVAFSMRPPESPRRWHKVSAGVVTASLLAQAPALDDACSVVTPGGRHVIKKLDDLRVVDGRYVDKSAATPLEATAVTALDNLQQAGWQLSEVEDRKRRPVTAAVAFDNLALRGPSTVITRPGSWGEPVTSLSAPVALDYIEGHGSGEGLPDPAGAALVKDLHQRNYRFRDRWADLHDDGMAAATAASAPGRALVGRKNEDGDVMIPIDAALLADPNSLERRLDETRALRDRYLTEWLKLDAPRISGAAAQVTALTLLASPPARWDAEAWKEAFGVLLVAANWKSGSWNGNADRDVTTAQNTVTDIETTAADRTEFLALVRGLDCGDPSTLIDEINKGDLQKVLDGDIAMRAVDPADLRQLKATFFSVLAVTGSVDTAQTVFDMVAMPVPGTTLDDRIALFGAVREAIPRYDATVAPFRIRAFNTILAHHLPGEPLAQTALRFTSLLADCSHAAQETHLSEGSLSQCAAIFAHVQEGTRRGVFGEQGADAALVAAREGLLYTKDVRGVLDALPERLRTMAHPGTIERKDDTVVIGGVVLSVRNSGEES